MDLIFGKKSGNFPNRSFKIQREGHQETISYLELEEITKVKFVPQLEFDSILTFANVIEEIDKFHKKKRLSQEALWLGSYYRKELLNASTADLILSWIDPAMGWGVFAARDFKKKEFIAEYAGKVRKRTRSDWNNGYCFEYLLAPGIKTPYTIDAREQGGIARYINHSFQPNLAAHLASFENINYIILLVEEPIAKGEQLLYNYGIDYWSNRPAPRLLVDNQASKVRSPLSTEAK